MIYWDGDTVTTTVYKADWNKYLVNSTNIIFRDWTTFFPNYTDLFYWNKTISFNQIN